ncbi:MAG: KH domain-containing protein [Atribacterota bacterium]|nr:KH domain-containing protein [Atribacterota bacterium]MDD4895962.1 KH domain-containing protein [Atribacterota bacterium]MDD5638080.1 KH domain-containing protein [Atribacterota bacterium]
MVDFENKEMKINKQEEKALQVLSKIAEGISADAEVKLASSNQDYTIFEIIKADPGIIIGKHGHTLDAIQYLVNLIVNKENQQGTHKIYIVDIDGYRKRREESLQRYAREKAEIAKRKGDTIALYYMNSIERKLVHMALKEDSGVITYSEGREPYRRIIIKPILVKDEDDASKSIKEEY